MGKTRTWGEPSSQQRVQEYLIIDAWSQSEKRED